MRILVLTPKFVWPLTGGAEIRNFNLLRETARHHEVFLVSFLGQPTDRDHFPAVAPFCRQIIGLDLPRPLWHKGYNALRSAVSTRPFMMLECDWTAMARTISQVVADQKIDVIHAHFLHMGQYVGRKNGAAFVYDPHNLDHILWERFADVQTNLLMKRYSRSQCGKFVRWERVVGHAAEKVVTLSDTDRAEYLRIAPQADISTVPNGADTEYYQPRATATEPDSIIYTAQFGWPPQDDAALYFHHQILPLIRHRHPGVKLYLVGRTPPPAIRRLAGDQVVVTGFVEDLRDYLGRAQVVVMPLRVGAGTKHRVYQALAMGKPLVATTVAAEGIALTHGEHALIADEPQQFADQVVRLLEDRELGERLGANGRRLIVAQYDWRANYAKLEQVFQAAVAKRAHRV